MGVELEFRFQWGSNSTHQPYGRGITHKCGIPLKSSLNVVLPTESTLLLAAPQLPLHNSTPQLQLHTRSTATNMYYYNIIINIYVYRIHALGLRTSYAR